MEDITDLLQDANAELKRGRVGVSIQQMRNRLFLRSVLPSEVEGKGATQQRLPTGEFATKSVLKRSVNLAHKLATDMKLESCDWSNWLKSPPQSNREQRFRPKARPLRHGSNVSRSIGGITKRSKQQLRSPKPKALGTPTRFSSTGFQTRKTF